MSNENGCYKISSDLRDAGADGAWIFSFGAANFDG